MLFVLVVEVFKKVMNKDILVRHIKSFMDAVSGAGTMLVTHLLLANDTLMCITVL